MTLTLRKQPKKTSSLEVNLSYYMISKWRSQVGVTLQSPTTDSTCYLGCAQIGLRTPGRAPTGTPCPVGVLQNVTAGVTQRSPELTLRKISILKSRSDLINQGYSTLEKRRHFLLRVVKRCCKGGPCCMSLVDKICSSNGVIIIAS